MIPDAEENSINFSPPRWICPELLTESCMLMLPWRGMRVPTGKFDGKFDGKFGVQTQRNGAVLKWKTTVLHLQEDQICASQGDGGWSLSLPSHSAWNLLGYRFFLIHKAIVRYREVTTFWPILGTHNLQNCWASPFGGPSAWLLDTILKISMACLQWFLHASVRALISTSHKDLPS